jgi:hypothetical protein
MNGQSNTPGSAECRGTDVEDYVGFLDCIRRRSIIGWALNRQQPALRLSVRVKVNDKPVATVKANRYRSDLVDAGFGDGWSGFECPLPVGVTRVSSVEAMVEETGFRLLPSAGDLAYEDRPLPAEWRRGEHFRQPSFFLLGAAKCGTTSLHYDLDQHPDILMSDPKEPFYFEAQYSLGPAFYFNAYFEKWAGERLVGESRHRNLYLPYVPDRIHSHNPDAKLIAILRNPIERVISHWWHWYSRAREQLPLMEALQADDERIRAGLCFRDPEEITRYSDTLDGLGPGSHRTYLDSGYYAEQLQRYVDRFGRDRLHVIIVDNFAAEPRRVLARVFEFLDCAPDIADRIDLAVLNTSAPGVESHVDASVVKWLADHYKSRNRDLEQFLNRSLHSWSMSLR